MSESDPVVITLTVSNVSRLEHILKWAEIADAIGLGPQCSVKVDGFNGALSVSQYEAHVPWPEVDEDDPDEPAQSTAEQGETDE